MTNEEMLSVAEIVERLVARFHKQADDHEAKMVEHRASFGARTKADAETIDRLQKERDGLLTQVQDMRAEMERVREERDQFRNSLGDMLEGEGYQRVVKERDALRAEVAELKTQLERLTSWAAKNQAARETLQTEIERLKSQTPKHPVKVGEWVRRITAGSVGPIGTAGSVMVVWSDAYQVQLRKGFSTFWSFKDCEPCDPPEATHDTPTGKQVAEDALRTEPVADEIKVGDVVEVFQSSSTWTFTDDVGKSGTITRIETVFRTEIVHLREHPGDAFALCDVRKVTT